MNVVPRRFVVVEGNTVEVIEFDHDHGAVDTVIEDTLVGGPADPHEVCLREVPLHLLHRNPRVPVAHPADVYVYEVKQLRLRRGIQHRSSYTDVRQVDVVAKRRCLNAPVHPLRPQHPVCRSRDGDPALWRRQRPHQREARRVLGI